ncbi:MAG: cytochrome-c peroxidase [Gemmatimonadales bacterium]
MRRHQVVAGLVVLVAVTAAAATRPAVPDREAISEIELGRLLFWDPILSGNRDVACASCHHPDFAYADGRALSLGTGSVGLGPARVDRSGGAIPVVKRNSPTVLNVAFNGAARGRGRGRGNRLPVAAPLSVDAERAARAPMFWDRRVRSLETQALEPLKAFEEMRGTAYPEAVAVDSVVARLNAIPQYVALFGEVYGPGGSIGPRELAAAISAFERSLVAMNSPFDRFRAGDSSALTPQQLRGMEEFDDAGCERCHDGIVFSDFGLEAEGVPEHPLVAQPDSGAGRFRFRTPSLRNVALTAPYMHNGTLATLEDVLRHYDNGVSANPNVLDRGARNRRGDDAVVGGVRIATLSGRFRGVDDMSDREMADIIAFLHALTDEDFDRAIPERVPSGLPPGGAIATATP